MTEIALIMAITIEELRAQQAQTMKELEDLNAAIRVFETMSNAVLTAAPAITPQKDPTTPAVLGDTGEIDLDSLVLPTNAKKVRKSTLEDDVRKVIERFPTSKEFTVNHVFAALTQMGKGGDAKHFKNRVSITVKKLVELEIIERSYEGKGNVAHKYKRTSNVHDLSPAQDKKELVS